MTSESILKALLRVFGGVSLLAFFPFIMPREWMAATHQWLGMGQLPDKPVVEYLARATSALCGIFGGLLLVLAQNVHRYRAVIIYQAAAIILTNTIGTFFGLKAGMPAWWMISDMGCCWLFCGGMLWVARKIGD